MREFFFEKGRAETAAQVEQVIQSLGRALGSCREVTPPTSITEMHRVHRLLMAYECAEVHCDLFASRRELYGPGIASLIEEGTKISVEDYQAAKNRTSEIQESWRETFNSFDVLAMPTTAGPAPASLATTGDPRWQSPWSLCGFPAITLPCGLSAEEMPVGLQLVSAENALLLAIAAECEERLAFQATPTFRTTSEMDSET